ncbi:MAG: glycosyltransferase family 39 protein [bacterium]
MKRRRDKAHLTRSIPEQEVRQENLSEPTLFSLQMQAGGVNTRFDRWEWVCLAILVTIAAALRFWRVGNPSFWCDESGSMRIALGSIQDILTCKIDVTPPLHMVLIHYSLMLFGNNEWAARLPVVIMGTAIIPVQYMLARIICGRRIAIVSSLFVCFSAYQIYYSRDAHGYSVYAFFSWLSLYFFCRIVFCDGEKKRHWIGYALASVLMVMSHFMGAVACLAQGIIGSALLATRVWKKYPWGPTKRLITGFALSAVAVAILLGFYMRQIGVILRSEVTPWAGSQLLQIDAHLLYRLFTRQGFGNGLGLGLFICLLVMGLIYATRRSRIVAAVLVLWLVFPYALSAAVDLGQKPEPRYFIFTYPSIAILSAYGVWAVVRLGLRLSRERAWGYSAALPVFALWAVTMVPVYNDYYRITGNDWPKRDVTRWIKENTQEGSIVLTWNVYELRWMGPSGYPEEYKIPNRTFAHLGVCDYNTSSRFRAFLEKYPEVAFLYLGDSPGWPKYIFGQKKTFTNIHGIYLARRGMYNTADNDGSPEQEDLTKNETFSASFSYNTEEDLILKARKENRLILRRLVNGFGFWLNPKDGGDWMTATGTAQVAIYQLGSEPRSVRLKARAVGLGVDKLEIVGPGGTLGSWQIIQNEVRDYALSISNMPPGKTMLTFKPGSGSIKANGQPPVVLFNNITTE